MRPLTCALVLTVSLVGAHGASAANFPGTGVGAIPDGLPGTPPQCGAPRTVSFAVTGAGPGHLMTVGVDFTFPAPGHTFVGDVDVVLVAPGGAPSMVVVSRIGVTTAGSFGDSSNYLATYRFSDGATPANSQNIWTVATSVACGNTCNVPALLYRTTAPGGTGQTNPAPFTSLSTTFLGLTAAETNGTWTLVFRDCGQVDTGTISAATLLIPDPNSDLIFVDSFEV